MPEPFTLSRAARLAAALVAHGADPDTAWIGLQPFRHRQFETARTSRSLRRFGIRDATAIITIAAERGDVDVLTRWQSHESRLAVNQALQRALARFGAGTDPTARYVAAQLESSELLTPPQHLDMETVLTLMQRCDRTATRMMETAPSTVTQILAAAVATGSWPLVHRLMTATSTIDSQIVHDAFTYGYEHLTTWTDPPTVLDDVLLAGIEAGFPWGDLDAIRDITVDVNELTAFPMHLSVLIGSRLIEVTPILAAELSDYVTLSPVVAQVVRLGDPDALTTMVRQARTVDESTCGGHGTLLRLLFRVDTVESMGARWWSRLPDDVVAMLLTAIYPDQTAQLLNESVPLTELWLHAVGHQVARGLSPESYVVTSVLSELTSTESCELLAASTQRHPWLTCTALTAGSSELCQAMISTIATFTEGFSSNADVFALIDILTHGGPVAAAEVATLLTALRRSEPSTVT